MYYHTNVGAAANYFGAPTKHFKTRVDQRCISQEVIELLFMYGEVIVAANAKFLYLKRDLIPYELRKGFGSILSKLVIVVSLETNELITTYRNSNPLRFIKQKLNKK